MIAQTACSRDEPVPKFGPASRMFAPTKRSSLSTKARSSRQAANRPLPKPVRSTRLSHDAGMIWSVSTSERSRGTARPVTTRTAFTAALLGGSGRLGPRPHPRARRRSQVGGGREVDGDGGGRGHRGRDQVGAPAGTLAALEVPVRGG